MVPYGGLDTQQIYRNWGVETGRLHDEEVDGRLLLIQNVTCSRIRTDVPGGCAETAEYVKSAVFVNCRCSESHVV